MRLFKRAKAGRLDTAQPALADFFAQLRGARKRVLLLDYDGTLAPFVVDPLKAYPYPGVCPALDAIMRDANTRVVFITGRWIRHLTPLLSLSQIPEIWGSHGWEHQSEEGRHHMLRPGPVALAALVDADHWAQELESLGARREQKPACLAIHWRGLPARRATQIREKIRENWALRARDAGLALHDFDGGIELRVPGRNKGLVVGEILDQYGPGAAIAFLGDDATDEDGFRILRDRGLGVLVRPVARPTAAACHITPPDELLSFLHRWHDTCGGGP